VSGIEPTVRPTSPNADRTELAPPPPATGRAQRRPKHKPRNYLRAYYPTPDKQNHEVRKIIKCV